MKVYNKLSRVWSRGHFKYIPNFRETFPELRNLTQEEISDRFCELGIDFYTSEQKMVNVWVRLTLPFAAVAIVIMFLTLPIKFMLSGSWGYSFKSKGLLWLYNWFSSLGLV